jgi:hypothetical protein
VDPVTQPHPRAVRRRRRGSRLAFIPLAALLVALTATPTLAATDGSAATADEPTVAPDESTPTPPEPPAIRPGKPIRPPTNAGPSDVEPEPPANKIDAPAALNLYRSGGFRYQNANYFACTATSVMDMLNFIAIAGRGGTGFRWRLDLSATKRDAILAWERTHDTLEGGNGSDPHGWRNALNLYGWGSTALLAGNRVYDDLAFTSYDRAIKAAVRAMIRYRKPVGVAAWSGRHAQMLTGYDGLTGDPFAVDSEGRYTNAFSISALYLTDPLQESAWVNRRIGYSTMATTTNTRVRFAPYLETDSPFDDVYTPGVRRARDEWYARWVVILPLR